MFHVLHGIYTNSLIDLPLVPCWASHSARCARNQVPITVAAMLVPLARAASAAQAVSALAYQQCNCHRSSAVLFQSLVSEFCFTFKCPLAELPAFQVCHTLAGTAAMCLCVPICTIYVICVIYVISTYMVFYAGMWFSHPFS